MAPPPSPPDVPSPKSSSETPVGQAVVPTHAVAPPVQVHDPLPQPKTMLLSCVPSTKAHDEPPPAQMLSSSQTPYAVSASSSTIQEVCMRVQR